MYKCKYFTIHELVPPDIYHGYGERAWQFLDDRSLMMLDSLREKFGSTTVNSYYWGGEREWSGLRTSDSPYYSPTSQHSFGRAFDCIFRNTDAETVRQYILRNPEEFPYITSMELGVSWLHFDCRNVDPIFTFYP